MPHAGPVRLFSCCDCSYFAMPHLLYVNSQHMRGQRPGFVCGWALPAYEVHLNIVDQAFHEDRGMLRWYQSTFQPSNTHAVHTKRIWCFTGFEIWHGHAMWPVSLRAGLGASSLLVQTQLNTFGQAPLNLCAGVYSLLQLTAACMGAARTAAWLRR